jgi:uncharacterized membrane protein
MSKKRLGISMIVIGAVIIILTLVSGLIGYPKTGFGYLKLILLGIGLLPLFVGAILLFVKGKSLDLAWAVVCPRNRQEWILLSLGLLIGLLLSISIPYGAGFDEQDHMTRLMSISQLKFIPNQGDSKTLWQLQVYSYQRQYFQIPAFYQFDKAIFLAQPAWGYGASVTNDTYFPAVYIFPATVSVVSLGWLHSPLLPAIILMRFVEFLFYLLACLLTLRMLPTGKWVFLVIALTPTALFQAATINGDSFTIACSLLFIGAVLKVSLKTVKSISVKEAWLIAVVSLLLGLTKSGTILLLLSLLVFIRFKSEHKLVPFIILAGALISMIISIGWMTSNVVNADLWANQRTYGGQLKLVLSNFLDFLSVYFRGIFLSLGQFYTGWVGAYGYWVGQVPVLVYLLFPLALIAAFLGEAKYPGFYRKHRLFFLVISVICIAGIESYEFIGGYTPGTQISNRVGRIFLPFTPLFLLALSGWISIPARLQRISRVVCIGVCFAFVGAFSYGLYLTYYTDCVYAVTPSHPCTLPVYKNLEVTHPYVAQVDESNIVYQSFQPKCSQISSVIVRVESATGNISDRLVFSVLDENKNILSSKGFSIFPLKRRDLLQLPVSARVYSDQPTLWIELGLDGADSSGAAVEFLGRQFGKIYPDGELYIGQLEQDGDLFFQYACSTE